MPESEYKWYMIIHKYTEQLIYFSFFQCRRKYRMSAADDMHTASQKKRMFSDSWIGKKLSRKSQSVDDELLDPERHTYSRQSMTSSQSAESDDRSHIYDVVTEFKTITEGNDDVTHLDTIVTEEENNRSSDDDVFERDQTNKQEELDLEGNELYDSVSPVDTIVTDNKNNGSSDEDVFETDNMKKEQQESQLDGNELYDSVAPVDSLVADNNNASSNDEVLETDNQQERELQYQDGNELYDSVAPDHKRNMVEVIVEDNAAKPQSEDNETLSELNHMHKVESVEVDESTARAFEDPTYIEELSGVDDGVEELRKMIRDSGLDFDDTEDDYERIEGIEDEDVPAMAKLREMLGGM